MGGRSYTESTPTTFGPSTSMTVRLMKGGPKSAQGKGKGLVHAAKTQPGVPGQQGEVLSSHRPGTGLDLREAEAQRRKAAWPGSHSNTGSQPEPRALPGSGVPSSAQEQAPLAQPGLVSVGHGSLGLASFSRSWPRRRRNKQLDPPQPVPSKPYSPSPLPGFPQPDLSSNSQGRARTLSDPWAGLCPFTHP